MVRVVYALLTLVTIAEISGLWDLFSSLYLKEYFFLEIKSVQYVRLLDSSMHQLYVFDNYA